jgi:hypothetical protein
MLSIVKWSIIMLIFIMLRGHYIDFLGLSVISDTLLMKSVIMLIVIKS